MPRPVLAFAPACSTLTAPAGAHARGNSALVSLDRRVQTAEAALDAGREVARAARCGAL
ncbi:hypothetical protein SAMN02745121_04674 [Nannocystis exedens]|uniref:Uncharacterized protein n=1 Tax=Nannocystis exedens TaxID=54 RepID=A0A1I2BGY4_9BACT|nr:hypothetical protein [Nannocystis exedens]PCC67983.1 hypothetical protein NAEX_00991 [Nannocystis exedens]SFE55386.1 hypothetical protein SAMN02745121_04674 [Nannocystis exedens]